MSDLIYKISWERFCEKNAINDFEKYLELPMQQYPGLLDIRNLNMKNSGPLLEDLPDNCLGVLTLKLQVLVDNIEEIDSVHRLIFLMKMLCLIARNGRNFIKLHEYNVTTIITKVVDLSLNQLSEELNSGWLILLEYALYFLEIIYDASFSWRRRKKLFFNEFAQLETSHISTKSLNITPEMVTWLCTQLNAFDDQDTKSRLMHLFCGILSGSKDNAQFLISPAIIDVFRFDSDVNVEITVSYCCLIACLSEISPSQRQEELRAVLKKLLFYVTNKSEIRISELRCLYQLLRVSFELSSELINCGILTVIKICLTTIHQDHEQCRLCFLLLSELTSGHFEAQNQFLLSKGYDELLNYLTSNPVQAGFLLDLMFTWAVAEPFDASKVGINQYVIRDGHVIGLLIRWGTSLAFLYEKENDINDNTNQCPTAVVNWKAIFKLVAELCNQSRSSISRCCESGVIVIISECIEEACVYIDSNIPSVMNYDDKSLCEKLRTMQRKCDELLKGLFHLIELFCNYSVRGRDLKRILRLFKNRHTRTRCKKLIQIFSNVISEKNGFEEIDCWFELSQPGHCIVIAPSADKTDFTVTNNLINYQFDTRLSPQKFLDSITWKISSNGFSFHCWINLRPLSLTEKVNAGHERSSIFRLLSEKHNGFEVFLNMDGQLIVATCHFGEFTYVHIPSLLTKKETYSTEEGFIKPGKWNMINFIFQNAKTFFSKPSVIVYVNGVMINTVELKYPIINEKITVFHIGGSPKNFHVNNKCLNDLKSRKKTPFQNMRKTLLSEEHNTWGRISTLKCRIVSVACINDVLTETVIASLFAKGPMDTQALHMDETLSGHVLINYHACAFDPEDKTCFNLHSYIQPSRSNRFHAGHLLGERLKCHKFEKVITEIGGYSFLLPIIEQLEFMCLATDDGADQDEGYHFEEVSSDKDEFDRTLLPTLDGDRFIIVPDKLTDQRLNESVLASIVFLIRKLLTFETNQLQLEQINFIPILGALLQKIEIFLLDMNVVLAFHALADLSSLNIRPKIYQFILLDWRIWSRCSTDIRLHHCRFILNLVQTDLSFFRKNYGVIYFLDAIRFHHKPCIIDDKDIHKPLREIIHSIIFHLIHKDAGIGDFQKILKFIHECNDDIMIQEFLELLIKFYNSSNKSHPDSLIIYQNHLMESLFALLIKDLSAQTKEFVIQYLHLIVTSCRAQDKLKNHLLLNKISFASIFTFKEFCQSPLSPESIGNLLDIIKKAAAKDLFGVIQFLSLLTLSPVNQRISAVEMLKSFLDKSIDVVFTISKQPGWQDILVHLLVFKKREEKEPNISVNRNNRNEDINVKVTDNKESEKGFRRSSTWVFDDSNNDNVMSSSLKFNDVLEEDEDEEITDNVETEENSEKNSIDTIFLQRNPSDVFDLNNDNNDDTSLNVSMNYFHQRSCVSCSDYEELALLAKMSNDSQENNESLNLHKTNSLQTDDNNSHNELVDLVLYCLQKIMWTVLSSSNEQSSWMVVHQVMESLRSVNERYILMEDIFYFKQKIFIGLLNSLMNLFKSTDAPLNRCMVHSKELVYLIVDSSCHSTSQYNYQYDIELLENTIQLLQECYHVWDEEKERSEMAALGFFYLLTLSCDRNLTVVSAVCARLHQIVTDISKNITYEEISFILVHFDRALKIVIDKDNFYFIAPILKTILECHGEILQITDHLPNIFVKNSDFIENFKNYCNSKEWKFFIQSRLSSAFEMYETNHLNEMTTVQSLWRAQANEQMSLDRKKRGALSSDYRKRFKKEIINMTIRWIKEERKRIDCVVKDMQMQHEATLRHWRIIKQNLTSPKGCWQDELMPQTVYWKQSSRENYLRMRPRFDPNYQFNQHLDASKERDHPSHSYRDLEPNPLLCLSSLEGKIDFSALGDDQLGDDEWMTVQNIGTPETKSPEIQNQSLSFSTSLRKNIVFECSCKLVRITEVIDGKFELTNSQFFFHSNNLSVETLDTNSSLIVSSINQIREIHLRRYNLRRSAIEIFLTDQTNYFFNFCTKTRNVVYSKLLNSRPPNLIYSKQRSPADLLKSSNLTQKWINREISNFEYLMQLNTIAGRTYNDMSQYPVFPWILADYTSPKLDLTNPKTFRDLSKPIGVVNPKNEPEIREKYESFEDPNGVIEKFHYGTHYSSAAGVMHYMVRVEPFTSMHIQLQSGKFDIADRQFHSIPTAWNFIMESPNDNKELIPEFFYQPEFLRNTNKFQFGLLQQTKTHIDDVELPAWAISPEDFIFQHQQALESEYVSQNLHHWIDLIFGYKQKGPEAVKALNVFYYVTYEGVVDLDLIIDPVERESIESMINNFGQTPCQLLKNPHPRRLTEIELRNQLIKVDKYLPVISYIHSLKHTSKSVCSPSEPIVFVRVPPAQTKSFIGTDRSLHMVTIHSSNIVAKHNWLPYYKSTASNYHIDIESVFDTLQVRRKAYLGNLSCFVESSNKIYDITPDCKFVIAGGNIDKTLTIMSLLKRTDVVHIMTPHHLPISCVSIDIDSASPPIINTGSLGNAGLTSMIGVRLYGITGSLDSTCVVWDWTDLPSVSVIQVICGHTSTVTSVSLSMYLDIALTGSEDGTVNLHSVIRGQFLHTIIPGTLNSATLSINFVSLSRTGYIYVQWQNGPSVNNKQKHFSASSSCSSNYPKQYLSVYTLQANHISTCEREHSKVTVLNVVPKTLGSLENFVLIGNTKGELSILDGYYLNDQNTLNFAKPILDAQLLSANGRHLAVALSNGCLIISTVFLSNNFDI